MSISFGTGSVSGNTIHNLNKDFFFLGKNCGHAPASGLSLSELRESVMDREALRAAIRGVAKSRGSVPGPGRFPGEWLPILLFLPGEFHGQRSLVGYSSCGCKELDVTEQLTLSGTIFKPK